MLDVGNNNAVEAPKCNFKTQLENEKLRSMSAEKDGEEETARRRVRYEQRRNVTPVSRKSKFVRLVSAQAGRI